MLKSISRRNLLFSSAVVHLVTQAVVHPITCTQHCAARWTCALARAFCCIPKHFVFNTFDLLVYGWNEPKFKQLLVFVTLYQTSQLMAFLSFPERHLMQNMSEPKAKGRILCWQKLWGRLSSSQPSIELSPPEISWLTRPAANCRLNWPWPQHYVNHSKPGHTTSRTVQPTNQHIK